MAAVSVLLLSVAGLIIGLTLGLSHQTAKIEATTPVVTPVVTTDATCKQQPGVYYKAAVATDYGPCSDMGRDILQAGGSAIDAAITATLCLGMASPQSAGLGGGLFMVIYTRNGFKESITANEAAPAASDFNMFENDTDSAKYGPKAVSVPGELLGLWTAHQKYGVLPWNRLLEPVITMAEKGFPMAWHTEYCLKVLQDKFDRWPILRDLYTKSDGSLMKEGDIITAPPGMIQTLRAISDEGVSAFYEGEVGQKLVQDIQNQGGIMTLADLKAYDVTSQPPTVLHLNRTQHRVLLTPVTSSGDLVQFTVNVMHECNLQAVDFSSYEGKLKMYHYFIEASTFAIGLGRHIGDAGSAEVEKTVAALSSTDYARKICSMINDSYVTYRSGGDYDTFDDFPDASEYKAKMASSLDDDEEDQDKMLGDTSHLSVYLENGDAVSLTSSLGLYFGSRTFSNQTGMFLNSHMSNFYYNGRTPRWDANILAPGARAMSTMSPSIITDEDGSVKAIIGSSGGMRIVSTNAWVLLRSLWGNEELSDMIDAPRVYAYRSSSLSKTYYEKNFPEELVSGLRAMGHNMVRTSSFAAAQGILRQSDATIYAHSDPRKHGYPAGY